MKLHYVRMSVCLSVWLLGNAVALQAQPPEPTPNLDPQPAPDIGAVVVPPTFTPWGAIEHFVELYSSKQWQKLPDLIVGAENGATELAAVTSELTKAQGTMVLRVSDIAVEMARDEAIARLTVHASNHLGLSMEWREVLKLRRDRAEATWKLRPSDLNKLDSIFDTYLQQVITLIAYPKSGFARGQRESLNQVKQLALGVKQFIQDHDEQYAFTPETVKSKIQPYIRNEALWTAPGDAAGTISYSLNPQIKNVNEAEILFLAETVLFYLGRDGKPDFRYGGRTVVGFADGHVELLTEEETKKLRWKP